MFSSFDRHSDKIVTPANCYQTSINSVVKYCIFSENFTEVASKLFELLWWTFESHYFFKEKPSSELIPVLLLQRIAELSSPSYILFTLVSIMRQNSSTPVKYIISSTVNTFTETTDRNFDFTSRMYYFNLSGMFHSS